MATALKLDAEQLQQQLRAARMYQERFDNVLKQVGMRAPQPVLDQAPDDYRRETLRTMKLKFLQNHKLGKINMRGLPSGDVLNNFEAQVLAAVPREANDPRSVPRGEMRKVEKLDEHGRLQETRWIGQDSFVLDPAVGHRPGRRVTSFLFDKSALGR
jgi:hypothetical protein